MNTSHPGARTRTVFSFSALALLLAAAAIAGPLAPPVGPVAPTAKPLTEVEPRIAINATNTPGNATSVYRISQPGSYYLTENLAGISGRNGIAVDVSNGAQVTIDLNGFELVGVPGTLAGIRVSTACSATIKNGVIRSWSGAGIEHATALNPLRISDIRARLNQRGFDVSFAIFTDCHADLNTQQGFRNSGRTIYERCSATSNTLEGFSVSGASVVSNSHASGNSIGFAIRGPSTVSDCTSTDNTEEGFLITTALGEVPSLRGCVSKGNQYGFSGLSRAAIVDSSASSNTLAGFRFTTGVTLTSCTSHANSAEGYNLGSGNSLTSCTATNNASHGFLCAGGSTLSACSASSNGTIDVGDGFRFAGSVSADQCIAATNRASGFFVTSGTLTACTASGNIENGFRALNGVTLSECSARSSNSNGFLVDSGCSVLRCTASTSTLAGIACTANGNTIDGCTVQSNAVEGILAVGITTIRNNTCFGNGTPGVGSGAGIHVTSRVNRIEGNLCGGNVVGIKVDDSNNFLSRNTCSANTSVNWNIAGGNECLVVQGVGQAGAIVGNAGGVPPGSTDPNANFTN